MPTVKMLIDIVIFSPHDLQVEVVVVILVGQRNPDTEFFHQSGKVPISLLISFGKIFPE